VALNIEVDCVSDAEDVLRVELVLHGSKEILMLRRQDLVSESLSDFTNSVMMRNAASVFDYLVSSRRLYLVINF
jgi:hypothetical protein